MTPHTLPLNEEINELLLPPDQAREIKDQAREYPSWDLTARQMCDIELLLNGAFSPLEGFMGYSCARVEGRLKSSLV